MLYLIVFLSGAVLMSLEMVGSRILAPSFGSSIYIWGSLIVVVMAALTLGYFYGGRIADQHPKISLMGLILALAGVFIGFLPFWTLPINRYFSGFDPRAGSLLAALAFFFIPSLLLATISPFAIKLSTKNLTTIGNTAGHLSAVSSAGSIIGTLVTSFFLIPAIGVRNIVHSLGMILLFLALIILIFGETRRRSGEETGLTESGYRSMRQRSILLILIAILLLGILWVFAPYSFSYYHPSEIRYERDSLYHHIIVTEDQYQRNLHFDNSYQSAIDRNDPLRMVFEYTSYLHLGVVAQPRPERVLFIGLGGGSAPKKFLHDYPTLKTVDVVEIDPEVIRVAHRYFDLPRDPKLQVYAQDGRLFVERKAGEIAAGKSLLYDLVIIDAYSASTIPYHLTTREFFQLIRRVLAPDGAVVANIIGAINGPKNKLLRAMTRTYAAVFPQIYLFPIGPGAEIDTYERNMILIATDSPQWDRKAWVQKAEELYQRKLINEDVPEFAQMLVDDRVLRKKGWIEGVPMLTDDFAPVDTLQNPLL